MKYVLNIIILFLLLLTINSNKKSVPAVSLNDDSYKIYSVYTSNLTTKNINKYFIDTSDFIIVYPKVNLIYKDKIGNIYYKCEGNFDINDFTKYYKKVLEKNNYKLDLINIDYYGINIEKIILYTSEEKINNILKKCDICSLG